MSNDQTEKDLIEKLAATWPKAFFINQDARKPLKIGIHADMAGQAHGLSSTELRRALSQYCRSPGYLAAMIENATRIDLDGTPAGTVTAEGVGAAVKAARLSQKTRRKQRETNETKMEAKASVVAAKQQTEKAAAPGRL